MAAERFAMASTGWFIGRAWEFARPPSPTPSRKGRGLLSLLPPFRGEAGRRGRTTPFGERARSPQHRIELSLQPVAKCVEAEHRGQQKYHRADQHPRRLVTTSRPSAIMPPQVGMSDEIDRPTKDRIASTMTAMPISKRQQHEEQREQYSAGSRATGLRAA